MSFAADIRKLAAKTEQRLDQVVRAVRLDAVTLVIEKMPVDTGQARGSVIASIGSPASSPKILDKTNDTAAAIARAQGSINAPTDNIFYVTSNIPYMKFLENGSSQQAPLGMFKISAIQLQNAIRKKIKDVASK